MRHKIFVSLCSLATIAAILLSLLVTFVMYREFYGTMRREVRQEADYIARAVDLSGSQYLAEIQNMPNTNRVTWISKSGQVLFDNWQDAATMDDHADRPEVSAALLSGAGEATRLSDTVGEQTFYYALRLNDGSVLRIACTTNSVWGAVFSGLPYILLAVALIFVFSAWLAGLQTNRIIQPINALDPENPLANEIYEELSPLLLRLTRQNTQINFQMAELQKQRDEFNSITEKMNEGLILLNRDAVILSVNQSALSTFHAEGLKLQGKHVYSLNRSHELQTAVEKSRKGLSCEEQLLLNGRCYQLMASPILEEDKPSGTVLFLLDITEKSEAEQLRREFSANVSHELKTPLTAISGFAEIIKDKIAKPEDFPRFAARIYHEAGRLITLVDDIIKLSQLDEQTLPEASEPVDLKELAQEVCERLQPAAQRREVALSAEGEHAVVIGSKRILDEMIFNLCDNGIKYNHPGGQVTVSITPTPQEIVLAVRDNGIGILPEHQSRIFERFYRVDKSRSKETGGTGLGLSIVKYAAKYHHAKIRLESAAGEGATFSICFPKLTES